MENKKKFYWNEATLPPPLDAGSFPLPVVRTRKRSPATATCSHGSKAALRSSTTSLILFLDDKLLSSPVWVLNGAKDT